MKSLLQLVATCLLLSITSGCASGYKIINPKSLNYLSNSTEGGISIEYKYNLLDKKYAKKELSKGIKLAAVKLTNTTDKNLVIGEDIKFTYGNNRELILLDNLTTYKYLKQSPASYLWYLLLTPLNFYTSETDSNGFERQTSSTPIGLVIGPGLTGGNMIAASSANQKLRNELLKYNILGSTIKKGETVYGLIGIRSNNYDAIRININ